jgi:two-component system phosphate regulon sensor histidine kinase PhoR
LVEDVVVGHQALAAANGQTLVFDAVADLPSVMGDRHHLERVLVNLVGNALQYTPEGGTVHLSLDTVPGRVRIRVTDTGVGIAPDEMMHIFERFYRAESSKRAGIEGTGLGLAIVKEMVEAHRGRIDVSSQLGQGSTFVVELPISEQSF